MRIMLSLLGLILMLFGLGMCFGAVMEWRDGTIKYPVGVEVFVFVLAGLAPLKVGRDLFVAGILLLLRGRGHDAPRYFPPLNRA